jgi:hypothetical protein
MYGEYVLEKTRAEKAVLRSQLHGYDVSALAAWLGSFG